MAPEHADDFRRLSRSLILGPPFQLYLAEFGDSSYRDWVIRRLDDDLRVAGLNSARVVLNDVPDVPTLEAELREKAAGAQVVHLLDGESWFDPARWDAFNARREAVARDVRARLVLWLHPDQVAAMPDRAADWWSWRTGIVNFLRRAEPASAVPTAQFDPADNRPVEERRQRVRVLRAWLDREPRLADEVSVGLWRELAELLRSLGASDEALRILTDEVLPAAVRLGRPVAGADAVGAIATLYAERGDDQAAMKLHDERLGLYEQHGNKKGMATTLLDIGRLHATRGDLAAALAKYGEALRIFDEMGDRRARAATLLHTARVHVIQGDFDSALPLLAENVQLFEQLDDKRARAVMLSEMGRLHTEKGELDTALALQRDVLQLHEEVGDKRSIAVALGDIARVLALRGETSRAIDLQRKRLITVRELDDSEGIAATTWRLGQLLSETDPVEAAELFAEAWSHVQTVRRVDAIASIGLDHGGMLASQGLYDQSRAVLEQVKQAAEKIGWKRIIEAADEILAQIGDLPDTPPPIEKS